MKKRISIFLAVVLTTAQSTNAASFPDEHAPIGIMGDHTHKKGGWMVSYRYSNMNMDGNRIGTSPISIESIKQNFMVAPLDMTMQMHMVGLMYGLTDKLTIMTMVPYAEISMNLQTRMGMNFSTSAKGIGDVKLSGLYSLYKKDNTRIILNAGLSIPSGSINKTGDTPMGSNMPLPYPMQIGSGTYNLMPGLTYSSHLDRWSWGAQLNSNIRMGTNNNGYTLGDQYAFTVWGARRLSDSISVSLRTEAKTIANIKGSNPVLNPMVVPTARTDLRHGNRVDMMAGLNFIVPGGPLEGNRLAVEFTLPVYQKLDGPQLETDYRLMAGWQLAF
ncbi:MAG: transporter [Kordiimonadaceae bacterium]|nr:transporter [Kordiimonadaceae bacterium]